MKKQDKKELASLYQNMYLTYVSERNYDKAIEMVNKSKAILEGLDGERHQKLSAKYF